MNWYKILCSPFKILKSDIIIFCNTFYYQNICKSVLARSTIAFHCGVKEFESGHNVTSFCDMSMIDNTLFKRIAENQKIVIMIYKLIVFVKFNYHNCNCNV